MKLVTALGLGSKWLKNILIHTSVKLVTILYRIGGTDMRILIHTSVKLVT